jgi:hypothetical protein
MTVHRTSYSSSSRTLALGAPMARSIDPPLPTLHLVMDVRKHSADLPQVLVWASDRPVGDD